MKQNLLVGATEGGLVTRSWKGPDENISQTEGASLASFHLPRFGFRNDAALHTNKQKLVFARVRDINISFLPPISSYLHRFRVPYGCYCSRSLISSTAPLSETTKTVAPETERLRRDALLVLLVQYSIQWSPRLTCDRSMSAPINSPLSEYLQVSFITLDTEYLFLILTR
jgi:hypothetical protein